MLLSQVWEGANKVCFDDETLPIKITRGVSHCGLAISVKKYLNKAKEELWKFKSIVKALMNMSHNVRYSNYCCPYKPKMCIRVR